MSGAQYKLGLQFPEVPIEETEKVKFRVYKNFNLSLRRYDPIEYENPQFDFIAYPFVFLLGLFWGKKRRSIDIKPKKPKEETLKKLAELVGSDGNEKDLHELRMFLVREARLIKRDTAAKMVINPVKLDYIYAVLEIGFERFEKKSNTDCSQFRRVLREILPGSSIPMQFSLISRFVANGNDDVSWYEDTKKVLIEAFPDHDISVICDLFAATSIRASLKSNVTKFFKAFAQLHERRVRMVKLGKVGEKQEFPSLFEGFLDATIVNLNKIANGEELSARKIMNFSKAMQGKKDAVVVDIWIQRAFDTDALYPYKEKLTSRAPSDPLYNAIEWYIRELANFLGFEPREISAMIWGSIRAEEDKTAHDVRYDWFIKHTLNNGLFADQYGGLSFTKQGLQFIYKEAA